MSSAIDQKGLACGKYFHGVFSEFGQAAVQADVTFTQDVAPWMTTPAFSRAAPGQRETAIGVARRAAILFRPSDAGKLIYMEEE